MESKFVRGLVYGAVFTVASNVTYLVADRLLFRKQHKELNELLKEKPVSK